MNDKAATAMNRAAFEGTRYIACQSTGMMALSPNAS
jgi:hypothetical protein